MTHILLHVEVWSTLTANVGEKTNLHTCGLLSSLCLIRHAQSSLHLPHLSILLRGSSGAEGVRWVIWGNVSFYYRTEIFVNMSTS